MDDTAVTHWFGPHFAALHPLLQALHRSGGRLSGRVAITFGKGPAGWIGRRLGRRLGLPTVADKLGPARAYPDQVRSETTLARWRERVASGTSRVSAPNAPLATSPCAPTRFAALSTLRVC
jgi:hypothetical protein